MELDSQDLRSTKMPHQAAWMGGGLGGEWTHVYAWPGPSAVHLKLSQLC